jgi:ABC-type molybdate transport system substrate-binding protein
MPGRHVDARARTRARPRIALWAVAGVVILALVAGTAVYLVWPSSSSAAGPDSLGRCTSGVSLDVVAAPALAQPLRDIADHWAASHPDFQGACPTVNVRSETAAAEEAVLAKPDVTMPDLWVPDSSMWLQRLRSDIDGTDAPARSMWTYPAVATSTLVLAASAERAAALSVPARSWAETLGQANGVAMTDPATDTAGLLTLLTTQAALDSPAAGPSRELVSTLVKVSGTAETNPAAGFLALRDHAATAAAFPTSAQAVTAAAKSTPGFKAVAVQPSGKALSFDYPVIQFTRPGGDPNRRNATAAFVNQLRTSFARARFASAGFRDRAGASDALARPTSDQVADGLRVWTAARRGNRALMVIDLSGSMAEKAGGSTKIRFAATAARSAVTFFPDTSSLGLWGFSVNRSGSRDWSELVPLGPLGSQTTGGLRRTRLLSAAARLPQQTGGNTGLYNTTIAAYEKVRSGWDPAFVNSVVLLTDGANTDRAGIRLSQLLARLRSETSTARPLPIITIAVGPDADVATLRKISAATHGQTYTVANPADIRSAFLDALISAGS